MAPDAEIDRLIAAFPAADVALAAQSIDPHTTARLFRQSDVTFHAASIVKVPVMIDLFRQAADGLLDLDGTLVLQNQFRSVVDGCPFELSPVDDSEKTLYERVGCEVTFRTLCELMITRSSNLATNNLIQKLGIANIQKTTDALGASGMRVIRGVEDGRGFAHGINNTATAASVLTLLLTLAWHAVVTEAASRAMVDILARQQLNDAIPAGVPPGTIVAHKTGRLNGVHHDAAIVFAPHPYVIVVLTRGIDDSRASARLIANIAAAVDRFFEPGV